MGDRSAIDVADVFTCVLCGGTFAKGWSDAEAIAERERLYPGIPPEDFVELCEDCLGAVLPTDGEA